MNQLVTQLKLTSGEAEGSYQLLIKPSFGFTPDAKFDMEGFRNALAVRTETESAPGSALADPQKYVDLSYYERAIRRLGQ